MNRETLPFARQVNVFYSGPFAQHFVLHRIVQHMIRNSTADVCGGDNRITMPGTSQGTAVL